MKVALVYDRVNTFGGAERVLLSLHTIWPDAPLYTAVYDRKNTKWAEIFQIHPSFLQSVPLAKSHHEFFPWLTPMAFESFSFDAFDVVISITSAEAKAVITKPTTTHICYCLTPTRYLWSAEMHYQEQGVMGVGLRVMSNILKKWDVVASSRPDYYLAISDRVKGRIEKYYHRKVEKVIYPPVNTVMLNLFQHPQEIPKRVRDDKSAYFLCVSRFVSYKRLDIIIDAFNALGWPLVIIGHGRQAGELKQRAKKNITIIDHHLTDDELASYYGKSRAFVFAADEDFGIVSLEAQAAGIPVICFRDSGMAETVVEGKTGEFFDKQTVESFKSALEKFDNGWYDSKLCRKNAERFSEERFRKEFKKFVDTI